MSDPCLIVSIVRKGWGDTVLAATMKAGARGGTVLFGRGIGRNEQQKVFGIQIEPEKEIVLTIVSSDHKRAILDEVVRVFGVTLDEAQHLADTQGLAGPEGNGAPDGCTQDAVTDAAAETVEELVRQMTRTLHFMETQRRHLQPSAVWLMGGGASMRNVGPYLADRLPLPVHIWTVPAEAEPIPCAAGPRSASRCAPVKSTTTSGATSSSARKTARYAGSSGARNCAADNARCWHG